MSRLWQTIRSYLWWTHDRGSVHYDVMVTLILAFIFLAPHWINFKDKPVERIPHQTGVVVFPDRGNLVYQVDASAVVPGPRPRCGSKDDAVVMDRLRRIIEPISGEVSIAGYDEVCDSKKGNVIAYRARVRHP